MKARRTTAMAAGAALLTMGLFAAPSVEITAVQQQYPWTNTVDITYEVRGVTNMEYFVRFTPTTSDDDPILNTAGEASIQVALTNNGTYVAQWFPQTNLQYTACKMTPAIFRGGSGGGRDYMIVDLATGAITYEPMATQAASNERYNTDEYKTTKMVFRKVAAGKYPVRRIKNGTEYGTEATMDKDYYISIFHVTAAQYNRIKDAGTYTNLLPKTGISYSTLRGNALARANVVPSANGDVIARLNYKTGRTFDLPDLAMSQVAAHANASKDWPWFWGSTDAAINTYARTPSSNKSIGIVGSLGNASANPWGIFDAYGNVWERPRDTVTYVGWNGTGSDNDDASLTQLPTQAGGYCFWFSGAAVTETKTTSRTACTSRDTALNSSIPHGSFRLALIVE